MPELTFIPVIRLDPALDEHDICAQLQELENHYSEDAPSVQLQLEFPPVMLGPVAQCLMGALRVFDATIERLDDRPNERFAFRRTGRFWTVAFECHSFLMEDLKGMQHLHFLLGHPHEEVPAGFLTDLSVGRIPLDKEESDQVLDQLAQSRLDHGSGIPLADAKTKGIYLRRLGQLEQDIDRAARLGDPHARQQAEAEKTALMKEITSSFNLKGRPRLVGVKNERARLNVTRQIRDVISRLGAEDESLGEHLAKITTGSYCSYRPRRSVGWLL